MSSGEDKLESAEQTTTTTTDAAAGAADTSQDKDLDDLLDSALEDFNKPITTSNCSKVSSKEKEDAAVATKDDLKWCNEFLGGDQSAFDEAIRSILTEDPDIAEGVKRFAEIANKAATGEVTDEEIGNLTKDFLSSAAPAGDNATATALSEDFTKMFENLRLNENEPVDENSFPQMTSLMQNVMQMLLSKDLLYPALKDISTKYPAWLEEHKATLPPEKFDKYSEQQRVIVNICTEFESEAAEDPTAVKQCRYQRILDLMQKMQDCGQPPADLIGEMGTVECDENGLPRLPGFGPDMNERCSLM